MRYACLLLSAAFFAFVPVMARADNAAKASVAPAPARAVSTPVAASTAASTPAAAAPSALSDGQRAEVEAIIKDYLTKKNPEVLMEAMQELQKREQTDSEAKSKAALTSDKDALFNNPDTPVGGNPKGDVTVVEFFDYQCGYCKMSEPAVEKLIKDDKNVKFVYKDFPILGPVSVTAARASLASMRQGKYVKFHDALMGVQRHLTEDDIYKVAKEAGLDVEKLKKDMNDPVIEKLVEANVSLGQELGARGTPTFVIGDRVVPGAMQYDELKKVVDEARAPQKP